MRSQTTISGLLGLFLSLSLPGALAQGQAWEQYSKAGLAARQQGDYVKAEQLLTAAVTEAEKSGQPSAELVRALTAWLWCSPKWAGQPLPSLRSAAF